MKRSMSPQKIPILKNVFLLSAHSYILLLKRCLENQVQAEGILSALGIPASNAINMFYKQIILQRGLLFEVKMPASKQVDASVLSDAEMLTVSGTIYGRAGWLQLQQADRCVLCRKESKLSSSQRRVFRQKKMILKEDILQ